MFGNGLKNNKKCFAFTRKNVYLTNKNIFIVENISNTTVHPDDIKSTEIFKRLTKIQKKIYMNRNSRMSIQNSVNIALNVGMENWLKQTNGNWFHKSVVMELVELKIKDKC